MTSISELRKRSKSSSLEKLQKDLEKVSSGGKKYEADERFWKLSKDKAGNGQAVIRFLPAPEDKDGKDATQFVKMYKIGINMNGKWLIANGPGTIGKPCPVYEKTQELYDLGTEEAAKLAGKIKARTRFYSNIYVVKDFSNPENDGKVFLFEYPKNIMDKITAMAAPSETEQVRRDDGSYGPKDPEDVFDFWEGRNFFLKVKSKQVKVGPDKTVSMPTYEDSYFEEPSELFPGGTDEQYERVWSQMHSLQQFYAEDNFPSYDELKKQFERLMKSSAAAAVTAEKADDTVTSNAVTQQDLEDHLADDDDGDFSVNAMMEKLKAMSEEADVA